eukprot:TRINITY_DN27054_c0_g1_i1.p1 TRINITY_DN27054_c0_g1~~TRINITY_DN27054_c0_g1_i1.p1  ORF type:complete len:1039 (+),score=435.63 TRINITY_DN27054_c0_g1_i1:66-3182(+)
MVHSAFRLRKVEKVKSMTVLANVGAQYVVVGMHDGCVSMFSIDAGQDKVLVPRCFYKPKTGKNPIAQLIPLPELNLLLALAEGSGVLQFRLFDDKQAERPPDITLLKEVAKVSNVTCMAAKKENGKYSVVAGKRHKVYLLEYCKEEEGFALKKELILPDIPRSIAWNSYGVFTGYKKECSWMSVTRPDLKKPLQQQFSPSCIVSMPVTDEVLLLRDNKDGVALNTEAEPSRSISLRWSHQPHTMAYTYPFVLALSDRGVEVRAFPPDRLSRSSDVACQEIPVDMPRLTSLPAFSDLDAASKLRACIRRSNDPDQHGSSSPSTATARMMASTAPVLPTRGGYDGRDGASDTSNLPGASVPQPPIFVTTASNNGMYFLEPVPFSRQVEELVQANDFDTALIVASLLTPGDVSDALLRKVLVQHGFHLFTSKNFPKAMRQFKLAKIDPRLVIKMFSMLPSYVASTWRPTEEEDRSLREARSIALAEMNSRFSAAEQLKVLLRDIRSSYVFNPKDDPVKPDTSELGMKMASVDTALLHCLLLTAEDDVAPFLEKPNKCVLEDCEKILRQENPCRYSDIVALYKSKGLDRRALVLLRALGLTGSFNFSDQQHREPAPVRDSDLSSDELRSKQLGLNGTIQYLRSLNGADEVQRDLILEFSSWVLQSGAPTDKKLSMFWNHPKDPAAEQRGGRHGPVNPKLVLDHLKKTLPVEVEIHMQYLETMLEDPKLSKLQECRQNAVHEALIKAYIERIQALHAERGNLEGKASVQTQSKVGRISEEVKAVGSRLQSFLRSSDLYSVELMKRTFADAANASLFNRELAIIHSRLEQHEEALFILAHKLDSFEESLAYCDKESRQRPMDGNVETVLGKSASKGRMKRFDLHSILFSLLLNPPRGSGAAPKRDSALQLLTIHADKINSLQALKELPPDTPIQELSKWLTQVMKDVSLKQRETRLYMNLSKSEHQQVAVQRATSRKEHFEIRPETNCPVCRSKIGGNSFVAYYPNKVLVHEICATKQGGSMSVCPVTKRTFSALDELERNDDM